ncbi:uncharacterized protein [Amphiura filiformis]|uniref:uncharacterized protein isoform X1 n=1 Tax=Amphiura filiformis TaxID=82378 RepID=UPI003B21CD19
MSPKPYQCGVCGKAFRTVQVLQKHTQTFHMRPQMGGSRSRGRGRGLYHGRPGAYRQLHTSQARFMCVMCNRSFRSPDLLQDHMTRSHMGQVTPVQLTQSQETFDPSSVQTSQAPATATLQSLQQQQQEQQLASSISFQSPDDPNAQLQMSQSDPSAFNVSTASTSGTFITPVPASMFQGLSAGASTSASQRSPNPSRLLDKACVCIQRKERDAIYEKNRRKRRFSNKWKELHPWLVHDEIKDVMFCSWCRDAGMKGLGKSSNQFYKGTNSYRTSSIMSHVSSRNHHQAIAQRYARADNSDMPIVVSETEPHDQQNLNYPPDDSDQENLNEPPDDQENVKEPPDLEILNDPPDDWKENLEEPDDQQNLKVEPPDQ